MATMFGFEIGEDKKRQEKNHALVSELKQDSAFIFRVGPHRDPS